MLQCPLSFFDIEPLSQKCGEYQKLTNNNEPTKYFPTYVAVNVGLCCRKYYRLSISSAVYWKGCL